MRAHTWFAGSAGSGCQSEPNCTHVSQRSDLVFQTVALPPVLPDRALGNRATGHDLQSLLEVAVLQPRQTPPSAVRMLSFPQREDGIDRLSPLPLQEEESSDVRWHGRGTEALHSWTSAAPEVARTIEIYEALVANGLHGTVDVVDLRLHVTSISLGNTEQNSPQSDHKLIALQITQVKVLR